MPGGLWRRAHPVCPEAFGAGGIGDRHSGRAGRENLHHAGSGKRSDSCVFDRGIRGPIRRGN
jgi:hypothetical protein